jgi:hypothetical protein
VPGFERDVKGLFREGDRDFMLYVFDLWSYQDVKGEAANILERLEDGTMPCDYAWPEERIQVFRDWIAGGFEP